VANGLGMGRLKWIMRCGNFCGVARAGSGLIRGNDWKKKGREVFSWENGGC